MADKKKDKMVVKVFKLEVNFGWFFSFVVIISLIVVSVLLYCLNIPYMNILFGGFAILLLVVLAYYWMNSKGYYNNLGRIRRTFYTIYLLFMIYGFISEKIDFANWELLLKLSALVIFVDLAVFQNPNILKIWNTELKHEDEVREALNESKDVILKNAMKVKRFTQIIQKTDEHFYEKPFPNDMEEYQEQATAYLKLYSNLMEFSTSFFIFESPETEDAKEQSIKEKIGDISIRHAIEFSKEDKEKMQKSFSKGETLILKEGKLFAIPYYGDFYCMIVTIESKPELVDGIDASHILSMLIIFDWHMGAEEISNEEITEEDTQEIRDESAQTPVIEVSASDTLEGDSVAR